MTQSELNRAVSQVTGEDRETIAARGFCLLAEEPPESDDDLFALIVDWDQLQAERNTSVLARRRMIAVA